MLSLVKEEGARDMSEKHICHLMRLIWRQHMDKKLAF